jgi:putative Holliday junction resolvase
MAFDYGSKRIGVAVTDSLQIIATSLTTIHPKDAIDYIKKYLVSEEVAAFILGEPKQMDGSASQSAQQVKGFATLLKKNFADIPIEMIDERFTSKMASERIGRCCCGGYNFTILFRKKESGFLIAYCPKLFFQ